MKTGLNGQVLSIMQTQPPMTDWDQRGALGCARIWLEHKDKEPWQADYYKAEFARRDALTLQLVETLRDVPVDEAIEALREARAWVDAPFVDPRMLAYRAKHLKAVGSVKKNERLGLK